MQGKFKNKPFAAFELTVLNSQLNFFNRDQ
ncbi:hypothetical protein FHW89_003239 [Mucilaginibacter sp. SG564]|nr:hypothetical protein [Mucilaginibacter sp. SG564]